MSEKFVLQNPEPLPYRYEYHAGRAYPRALLQTVEPEQTVVVRQTVEYNNRSGFPVRMHFVLLPEHKRHLPTDPRHWARQQKRARRKKLSLSVVRRQSLKWCNAFVAQKKINECMREIRLGGVNFKFKTPSFFDGFRANGQVYFFGHYDILDVTVLAVPVLDVVLVLKSKYTRFFSDRKKVALRGEMRNEILDKLAKLIAQRATSHVFPFTTS